MQFSFKVKRFLPAVSVHVWGGLGSQLFGLVTANRLQKKLPHRRIHLIFHSSGVTQRLLELKHGLISNFKTRQKYDFTKAESHDRVVEDRYKIWKLSFKKVLKSLLLRSGIVTKLDSDLEYKHLRPWVLSIRGHYSGVELLREEIEEIMALLDLDQILGPKDGKDVCVHLRLGDLLHLENKSHISMMRIASLPEVSNICAKIFVFSDSETIVTKNLWQSEMPSSSCEFHYLDINQTIRECVRGRVFIGTNSKISLWIALFRLALGVGDKIYLPLELQHHRNTIPLLVNEDLGVTFY